MFNFLNNRRLRAIQEGEEPFYSFPDKHKQTSLNSLASIIPVMLASEKSTKIIARDPKSSTRNETVVKLSRHSLTITKPEISHQIDLCFDTLVSETSPNLFSIRSQNAKKLAWDIERIILEADFL